MADSIVIFNVKGNRYRLEVRIAYNTGIVVVRWAGTHAEYTKRIG
ncbi:MAG: type II toxin-antitoxin system HigB family toxin [Betaproteobacteria bacterium]